MQNEKIGIHGVKWGIIIGFVYCVMLLLRYKLGATNPLMFSLWIFLGFLVVLILLLISGFQIRKELGGFIELKEAFKAMFISVLIFEFFYALFNFIYVKYIDPNFFQNFRDATEALLQNSGQSQDKIDKTLGSIDVDASKKMGIFDLLKSYLFFVALSGIFAFLFALIIKRKRDPFHQQQENLLQP